MLNSIVTWLIDATWSVWMLVLIGVSGIYFSARLGFFQFTHHGEMWKRIFDNGSSKSGISTFASFCTTMAMRIGTGNVAGVAVAIYAGGPGAVFWMIIIGMTNAAVCFVECTLSVLYKRKIDGEYRGSGSYVAEYGMRSKGYGILLAVIFGLGAALFMPAAATKTISDAFLQAGNIPLWVTAVVLAAIFAVIVIGGIKRIGDFASKVVPVMTVLYLLAAVIIFIANITRFPSVLGMILKGAFGRDAVIGGAIGTAIRQGIKRGTFSSASGMGESMPAAAAAETSHPVKQGMANAAGVFLDTVVVCTCTAVMLLMSGCFNTATGYIGTGSSAMAEFAAAGNTGGVQFVQAACGTVLGSGIANWFIAIMLLLFSFTCIVSYYYEAETSILYLFQGEEKARVRQLVSTIMKVVMTALVLVYGMGLVGDTWGLSDLALGLVTWFNMVVVWARHEDAVKLYKDYRAQMKAGIDPYYDPDKPEVDFKGVDHELWREINAERIIADSLAADK